METLLGLRKVSSHVSIADMEELDFEVMKLPKLNERQRSFDERSLSELTVNIRGSGDGYENVYSPRSGGHRSGFDTPASSVRNAFEPHPMVGEAWDALRRSMVYFRREPVGTIAAVDHASEEVLNYDQMLAKIMEVELYISISKMNDLLDMEKCLSVILYQVHWLS